MSVLYRADPGEWWARCDPRCFYCLEEAPGHSIAVMGAGLHEVALHIGCAERLGLQLIQDAREAKLVGGGEPHWMRRTARALGSAVLLGEAAQ
jgi:hypothetical protein